ncbi:carboxypeptidase regulatory-like domain-containing protein [Deinococcus planocerae]|uniref:carboxypeptidase regulatory-like domain-containing protein n=1 Tax=Deinococcus planocerae TaxID=1737569 RepID=UPI000C7E9201|nr:carboxypeptidase regulatory-like domain-containing protein [Deinococcus planocerae]
MRTGRGRGRRGPAAPTAWWLLALGLACLGGGGAAPFEIYPRAAVQDPARKTITLGYRVRNVGSGRGEFTPQVTLPAGWRLLLPPGPLTLAPGEEGGGLVVLLPDERAGAGEYVVTLADGEGRVTRAPVNVAPQPRLSAAVADSPSVVVGEPYTARFTVVNTGNVAQEVTFTATNSGALPVEVTPGRASLGPGERAEVAVRVLVPPDLAASQTVYTQLLARGRSDAGASGATEVLPGRVPLSATHVTLPLTLSAEADGLGVSWRVAGQTRLPGGERVTLDLGSVSPLVSLERGPLTLSAGRQWYGQTPPGEDAPAPGVRVLYRRGGWAAEGEVYRADRETEAAPGPLAFGVGVGWTPVPGAALALDLRREGDVLRWAGHAGAQGAPGEVTAAGTLERRWWWQAAADARGSFPGGWRAGASAAFGVRGAQALLAFGREVQGDADAWRLSAGGSWAGPAVTLGVRAAVGRSLKETAPEAELGASLGHGGEWGYASLNYAYRSAPGEDDPRRHRAQLLAETFSPLHTTHELVLDADPGARLGYAGTVALPTEVGTFQAAAHATYDFGARAGTLGGGLAWEATWQGVTTLGLGVDTDDARGGVWHLQASAARVWPGGGRLSGAAGVRLGGGEAPATTFKLGVSWPLEVPLAARRDVGSLSGRVTDEAGAPVAGLLLRLGALATRTDERGLYTFAAVPPGAHYLTADAAGLGTARIALPALPARVEVRAAAASTRDLRLVRPAAVVGRVRVEGGGPRFGASAGSNLTGGLLLELRGEGGEVLRTLTDERGDFAFPGLAPGGWTLGLADGPLGRDAPRLGGYAPPGAAALTLASGERVTTTLSLVPRSRRVSVQDGGSLTPSPEPAPK